MMNGLKKLLPGLLAAVCLPAAVLAQETAAPEPTTGEITVVVTDLKNDQGQVKVMLADSQETFFAGPKDGQKSGLPKIFKALAAYIENQQAQVVFKEIPFGTYAVMLFHDENENDKIDRNFMGIPKEAHGFSNNAEVKMGRPPKFDDAKFELDAEMLTITISVE